MPSSPSSPSTPSTPSARSAPVSPGLGRRRFVGGASALGLLAASGCATSRSGGLEYDLGGDRQLRILTWSEYIDPDLVDISQPGNLQAELGLDELQYVTEYEDNVAAWESIIEPALSRGDTTGYDIIVPTNWLAARMIERGWVEPLPIELIPNHVNIEPAYLTQGWDRGARYQMPWQAGITGIAYNPAQTGRPLDSVSDLFDPAFAGKIGMIVEMREAVGFAMLALGDDPSHPTVDSANRAMTLLEEQNALQRFVWIANEFADGLADESLTASMAWSGDTVLLQADFPEIEFVIPEEGAIQWFDTMVIPKGSPNIAAAGKWMNAVYNPETAAQITSWVQYISPVVGVRDELIQRGEQELANNAILFPDDVTKRRLFTWGQLAASAELALEDRFARLIA